MLDAYSFDSKWKKLFEKDWKEYDDFFYENLEITNQCGFIITGDGIPIGHISWDLRNLPDHVRIGHNCILTKYKGNGYGHILLKEAIKRIKTYKNIHKIIVTTNEELVSAQHNYESVGFQLKEKRKNTECAFLGDYIDYEMILS